MPKYRFEFPGESAEPVYVELPDIDAAKEEALKAMTDAILDSVADRRDPTGLATKVYDEAGHHLATINFADFAKNPASLPANERESDIEEPGVIRSG